MLKLQVLLIPLCLSSYIVGVLSNSESGGYDQLKVDIKQFKFPGDDDQEPPNNVTDENQNTNEPKDPEPDNQTLMDFILTNQKTTGLSYDANSETWFATYNHSCKTVYIVPGYLTGNNEIFPEIVKAYMALSEPYNVIFCPWPASHNSDYIESAQRVYDVGGYLGQHIIKLYGEEQNQNTIEIVGQGLGAHVAGCAGKTTQNIIQVDVIHGLDPQGQLFTEGYKAFEDFRLTATDATKVICLHTSTNGAGTSQNCGKYDFFANGGAKQPGLIFEYNGYYSQMRAASYFNESIHSDQFVSRGSLGFPTTRYGITMAKNTPGGQYYFKTNSRSPFARGAN